MFKKRFLTVVIPVFLLADNLHALGIGAWGGYNFNTEKFDCSVYTTNGGSCEKGGISLGLDVWLFSAGPVNLGVSAGYLSLLSYDQNYTTSTGSRQMNQGNASLIPVTAGAEIQLMGFIAGIGIGPAFYSGEIKSDTTAIKIDTTLSETLMAVEFHAGYGFGLGPITIAPEMRFYYNFGKDSNGTKINDSLNIVPSLLVSFKF